MQKIICFHNPNEINGFLSNWYPSRFTDENQIFYTSMEQYMMYQKAVLFGDKKTAEKILSTDDVAKIKALGRKVSGFNEKIWSENKFNIVYNGVYLKFAQNPELKAKLLSYEKDCIFAECAVYDKIWGIGLSMHNPDRFNKSCWLGENLLGKIIGEVRDNFLHKIICFHNPKEINGFLSNWYLSKFKGESRNPFIEYEDEFFDEEILYTSVLQYMMYWKAILFDDDKTAEKILDTDDFAKIKALGRQVSDFNEEVWYNYKFDIVCKGVYLKFSQNPELKAKLLSYEKDCIFAECAVHDKIWGIGLSMHNPDRFNKSCWLGENLLGKAITEVRDCLIGKSV